MKASRMKATNILGKERRKRRKIDKRTRVRGMATTTTGNIRESMNEQISV